MQIHDETNTNPIESQTPLDLVMIIKSTCVLVL